MRWTCPFHMHLSTRLWLTLTPSRGKQRLWELHVKMMNFGLWVHWWSRKDAALSQIQINSAQLLNTRKQCTHSIALGVIWTTPPLRGSYCGIVEDWKLKLIHVCLLPLSGLPMVADAWRQWGPMDKGEPYLICPLYHHLCCALNHLYKAGVVALAFCPPCWPPGVNSILHHHYWFDKGKSSPPKAKRQDLKRPQDEEHLQK